VLVDESTDLIVGAHLLGHNVEEVINAFAVAMSGGLTTQDLKAMAWAYPYGRLGHRPNAAVFERLVRQADLEMLAMVGGRERTAAEYEELFTGSGFALSRIVPLEGMPWMVLEGSVV
jgi:hypothetical protein